MQTQILKIENLRKTFHLSQKQRKIEKTDRREKVAVDNLSFSVNEGEIYGLLGPNGAGKTTTLRSIATLLKPDSGDILVGGVSAVKNPDGVRSQIGFMTGELKLEEFFSPNYLFDFFSDLHGIEPSVREQRKHNLFKKFGIDTFAEVRVGDLSTGMKQKVSLVISIVHDPKIIIFDEPTNGLDVITAKTVTDFLQELKSEGKSIIISTHIFSLVEKLCDSVGIIINGRMIVSDSLSAVCGQRPLEEVFFDIYKAEVGEDA